MFTMRFAGFSAVIGLLLAIGLVTPAPVPEMLPSPSALIGGDHSLISEWPFMAHLLIDYGKGVGFGRCGGVVWNAHTVVTVANCLRRFHPRIHIVNPAGIRIYLGHTHITDTNRWNLSYVFTPTTIRLHEHYNHSSLENDIAILTLSRKIDFADKNDKVQPVPRPLPLSRLNETRCITMGWGVTVPMHARHEVSDELRQARLPIRTSQYCHQFVKTYNHTNQLCAGNGTFVPVDIVATCEGDSGNPLMCPLRDNKTEYHLVGLAGFGGLLCGAKIPSYFARMDVFTDWLMEATRETTATTTTTTTTTAAPPEVPPREFLNNQELF